MIATPIKLVGPGTVTSLRCHGPSRVTCPEARRRLNFSEWDAYASDPDTAGHKLAEIADEVSSGRMAPLYYRAMHARARLKRAERDQLIRWARASSAATRSPD